MDNNPFAWHQIITLLSWTNFCLVFEKFCNYQSKGKNPLVPAAGLEFSTGAWRKSDDAARHCTHSKKKGLLKVTKDPLVRSRTFTNPKTRLYLRGKVWRLCHCPRTVHIPLQTFTKKFVADSLGSYCNHWVPRLLPSQRPRPLRAFGPLWSDK